MRSQKEVKGSAIWNLARSNKELIREYNFWEIKVGDKANFLEESWQQREMLIHKEALQVIQAFNSQAEGMWSENFGNQV